MTDATTALALHTTSPRHNAPKALAYLLSAVFLFETVGLCAKMVLQDNTTSLYTVIFARSFFAFIILALMISVKGTWGHITSRQPRLHMVRGVIGFLTLLTNFYAMKYLDLGTLTALQFTMPFFMMILAALWLKEKLTPTRWTAVFIGFIGTLFVAHPAEGAQYLPLAVAAALASAFLGGTSGVIIRKLTTTDSSLTVALSFAAFSSVFAACLLPLGFVMPTPIHFAYLIGAGISGGLAQLLLTQAYRFAPVHIIAPFEYSSLLWAMSFSWIFWDVLPTGFMLIGAAIIIVADLYVLWSDKKAK